MNRTFCDICDKPAAASYPEASVSFPLSTWRGSFTTPGSISPTDGTWIPKYSARAVFDVIHQQGNPHEHKPDLCADCMVMLLGQLVNKLKTKADK